jgi:hypothetical protein
MKKLTYAVKLLTLALVLLVGFTSGIWAQVSGKVKVAAIYTVPVEQQWVSRIHKALNAAKARGEIEYSFYENQKLQQISSSTLIQTAHFQQRLKLTTAEAKFHMSKSI